MTSDLSSYQYYIFDLDNTLYPEIQYLQAAWKEIGQWLNTWKPEYSPNTVENWLSHEFHKQGRTKLFDRFIQQFELENEDLEYLLDILRTVQVSGGISLFPEIESWIKSEPIKNKSLFIITNGNPIQQKNKYDQLIRRNIHFEEFLMANTIIPKPDPAAFIHIQHKHHLNSKQGLSIGDSEEDRLASEGAGIDFISVEAFKIRISQSES